MSTGATVALVAVAGAAVVGGYFLYKQSANTGGKSSAANPTNYALTDADFVGNRQISAKVGDTVTVSLPSMLNQTLTPSGVVSGSGTSYTLSGSGAGTLVLSQPAGSTNISLGTVTFSVA